MLVLKGLPKSMLNQNMIKNGVHRYVNPRYFRGVSQVSQRAPGCPGTSRLSWSLANPHRDQWKYHEGVTRMTRWGEKKEWIIVERTWLIEVAHEWWRTELERWIRRPGWGWWAVTKRKISGKAVKYVDGHLCVRRCRESTSWAVQSAGLDETLVKLETFHRSFEGRAGCGMERRRSSRLWQQVASSARRRQRRVGWRMLELGRHVGTCWVAAVEMAGVG